MKKIISLLILFMIFTNLYANKIDEGNLLDAYFNNKTQEDAIKEENKKIELKKQKPFSLEGDLYLFQDSNINYLREIDDFINNIYDSSEVAANGVRTRIVGMYSHKHPWFIFNLLDELDMRYYQKYTTENRWKNSFHADAGWYGHEGRIYFSPGYIYESYSNERLFTDEDYKLTAEYNNLGINGRFGYMDYYGYDSKDSKYQTIEPYIFFNDEYFDFKAGYLKKNETCRDRAYSYNIDMPYIKLGFSHDSINIRGEYSHIRKSFKDILPLDSIARGDRIEKYKISWNKDNRLYEIFTDYSAEFKHSNLNRYDINLYFLEAGIRVVF